MAREILVLKHIEIEGPGGIERFFRNRGWPLKVLNLAAGDRLPAEIRNVGAVISLGGPMNVYEEADYPFLRDEDRFLKNAVKKEVPILGICLGAQLLAKARGAEVRRARQKEIGWYGVELTDEGRTDPLFAGLPKELEVFQWHEDTFDIPDGARHLSRSSSCPNQAFGYGKNAYGLQFHIEVTPAMIDEWIRHYAQEGGSAIDADGILSDAYKKKDAFQKQSDIIYHNFANLIRDRQ